MTKVSFLIRFPLRVGAKASNLGRLTPFQGGQGYGPGKSTNEVVRFLPTRTLGL